MMRSRLLPTFCFVLFCFVLFCFALKIKFDSYRFGVVNNLHRAKVEISSQSMVILAQFDMLSAELMRIQRQVNKNIDKMESDSCDQADALSMRSEEIEALKALLAQRDNDLREISTQLQDMVPAHKLCEARNESKLLKAKVREASEEQLIWSNKVLHWENKCKILTREKDDLCKQMEVTLAEYLVCYFDIYAVETVVLFFSGCCTVCNTECLQVRCCRKKVLAA
jgi:hypothetical protein